MDRSPLLNLTMDFQGSSARGLQFGGDGNEASAGILGNENVTATSAEPTFIPSRLLIYQVVIGLLCTDASQK
jgi:hypothetical protein